MELKIPTREDSELEKDVRRLEEMVSELDDQQLSESEQAFVDLVYKRLEIFEQQNGPRHEEAAECRKILHLEDPKQDNDDTIAAAGKETLQLQTLKSTINNVVADQMLSQPEAKILPETPDMQEAADDIQDLVHHVIYCANDFSSIHHRRCEDFYGPGTAVMQIAWDPSMAWGKGEIALIRWPFEAFLWDPYADNIQDCRAVMKVSWHPLSWYREHWPDAGRYVRSEDGTYNDVGKTDGQLEAEHADDQERALLIEYWWRTYNANTKRYTISVAYLAGHTLLEVHEDVYLHGMFPFVVEQHDKREGSLAGDGLVHELVPMMRYINRYAAYADMNARMSSKGRMLVRRESGIDKDALVDWKNDIVEGNRIVQGEDWNWMQSQPFNGTITNLMAMFQSDLKADSGANQFTRGETTGGIVSGKAINSLIQAGGKISSMRTEQLNYGFKQMVEQIIWLMFQYYDKDRTVMLTGRKDGKRREVKIDPEKLFGKKGKGAVNPPPYTVQIEVASRDPQRIANQNQMFMEAYTMSAQAQQFFPLSALFEILNLDGKDKILPVIRNNEHYQEQMQALQQQVEQMSQQLEQMQTENQNLKKATIEQSNAMATMSARRGRPQEPTPPEESPLVTGAQNNPGQELPT